MTNGNQLVVAREALRAAMAVLEQLPIEGARTASPPRYYTRKTAPVERRVWDRAIGELRREGKVYQPGREMLVLVEDLHRWIETQRPDNTDEASANVFSYDEFAAGVRAKRAAR